MNWRFLFLAFVFLLILQSCEKNPYSKFPRISPGFETWELVEPIQSEQEMPIARHRASGFVVSEKIYFGLGQDANGNPLKDFWEYDPSTNAWTSLIEYPGDKRWAAAGFVIDQNIYIGTGDHGDSIYYNDFYKYDVTEKDWSDDPILLNFPGAPTEHAIGFSINGIGYIALGCRDSSCQFGSVSNEFFKYSPSDGWSGPFEIDCNNCQGRGASNGFVIGNSFYLTFGITKDDTIIGLPVDYWRFTPDNLVNSQWVNFGDVGVFSSQGRLVPVAFTINNTGFVGLGQNGIGTLSDFYKFDKDSGWTQLKHPFPRPRASAVGVSVRDFGYVISGTDNLFVPYEPNIEVWRFNPN